MYGLWGVCLQSPTKLDDTNDMTILDERNKAVDMQMQRTILIGITF